MIHLEILKQVLQSLNLGHSVLDANGNLIQVKLNGNYYYFANSQTPFNRQDIVAVCRDKQFTHLALDGKINQPKTIGYLDPFCDIRYEKYKYFDNYKSICKDICSNFSLPIIIKPNKGAAGQGVTLNTNLPDVETAISALFNHDNKEYDYVILAQKYIDIKFEYRVLTVNGQIELMYLKDNSQGKFVGNLSPLHWENSKAKKVTDISLQAKIHKFIEPIFKTLDIFWCGLDIVIDQNGEIWLIELNTSPGFSYYLESNDLQSITDLYRKALTKYFNIN